MNAQPSFDLMPRIFSDERPPSSTPWGSPQGGWERIAAGICSCATASHGGFWISRERRDAMTADQRAGNWNGDGQWFEEDSDANLVFGAFPECFPPEYAGYAAADRKWRDKAAADAAERAAAKARGAGHIRAAVSVASAQFKPEFVERAQKVEAAFGERLVFVLDDNDRRAIVVDYKQGGPIIASTATGLDVDMLIRAPF